MSDNKDHSHMSSQGHSLANSEWLDAHFLAMQPEYEEMLRWVGLQQGWHVLDAACGNGSFLPLMANLVGASGKISAIDLATENIEIVEARAQQGKWAAPVATIAGRVLTLPYTDHSFDAVWCANTTQYLSDAELQQMLQRVSSRSSSGWVNRDQRIRCISNTISARTCAASHTLA